MTFHLISKARGFTLIELLMVIAILGALAALSIAPISNSTNEAKFQQTLQKLQAIRNAMVGDPTISENGVRTSFGYLGDIGAIPSTAQGIAALLTAPAGVPNWSVNNTARFAAGWNGPYLTSSEAGADFTTDAWGHALAYDGTAGTLTSLGADNHLGGTGYDSDITVQLPVNLQTATVYGFVSTAAKPYSGSADLDLNYPDGAGNVITATGSIAPANKGAFNFPNIPLGKRSVTVYIPNRGHPTQTLGPAIITVDNTQYVIPTGVLDTNSAGNLSCNNLGVITLAGGIALTNGNKTLNFNVNVSSNVNLHQIGATDLGAVTTWNAATINGLAYGCAGPGNTLFTCPTADDGTLSNLTPSNLIAAGNNIPVSLTFAASLTGSGTATVQFMYNLGCDQVQVTGL